MTNQASVPAASIRARGGRDVSPLHQRRLAECPGKSPLRTVNRRPCARIRVFTVKEPCLRCALTVPGRRTGLSLFGQALSSGGSLLPPCPLLTCLWGVGEMPVADRDPLEARPFFPAGNPAPSEPVSFALLLEELGTTQATARLPGRGGQWPWKAVAR